MISKQLISIDHTFLNQPHQLSSHSLLCGLWPIASSPYSGGRTARFCGGLGAIRAGHALCSEIFVGWPAHSMLLGLAEVCLSSLEPAGTSSAGLEPAGRQISHAQRPSENRAGSVARSARQSGENHVTSALRRGKKMLDL